MDQDLAALVVAVRDIADSLRVIAARETREKPEEKAVRLLVDMGTANVSAIAKAVGVSRQTLYRWPVFVKALDRLRAIEQLQVREPRATRFDEL